MKRSEDDDGDWYFLQSRRLGFRRWSDRDVDVRLAIGLWGDAEVTRLFDARGKLSDDDVRSRLKRELANGKFQYWPIFLLRDGTHVGACGLRPYNGGGGGGDAKNASSSDSQKKNQSGSGGGGGGGGGVYEFGVHLRPKFWGDGFASEAGRAVIRYAFETLNVAALFAGHHPDNRGSGRLLAALGFRYTHDEYYAPTGLQHPSYALTAEEYRRRRQESMGTDHGRSAMGAAANGAGSSSPSERNAVVRLISRM